MTSLVPAGTLRPTRSTSIDLVTTAGPVAMTVDDLDRTRPFLLLHGGAGRSSMDGFADLLAHRTHSRVLAPTHPGFGGTPRAAHLYTTRDLAGAYVALLDRLDLSDVTVIGNSFGGWVATEIALLGSPRVSGIVIVDGIGIQVIDHPITDVRGLTPAEIGALSFHDPSTAPVPPAGAGTGPSNDVNALLSYAGPAMSDPTLLARLADLDLPVHVVWGASDGIVSPDYGRAYAAAIPGAAFTLLPNAGHLPQVETPEQLLGALQELGR